MPAEEEYTDMSGAQAPAGTNAPAEEEYTDMSGAQAPAGTNAPAEEEYTALSGTQNESVYTPLIDRQTEGATAHAPAETDAPAEGEYSYARTFGGTTARAPAGTGAPAEEEYTDMSGAQALAGTEVREDAELYVEMENQEDIYEKIYDGTYDDTQAGNPLYADVYDVVAAQNAPPDAIDEYDVPVNFTKDFKKKLSKQLKGVAPKVRGQMEQLIAHDKVANDGQLASLTNDKTATWVLNNRVDQWLGEKLLALGRPVPDTGAVPSEELVDKVQTHIQNHAGIYKYNDVKSDIRNLVEMHLLEGGD